jgi:hypothetical protein
MDYYSHLLESYNKIKQRKFNLITEASKMSPEALSSALKYLRLAVSKSHSDNYVVPIPELGGDAKIFVARGSETGGKASKHTGKVVVQNVLGFQAMPVGDQSGNPLNNTTWNHFVGKFNRILAQPEPESETPLMMGPPAPHAPLMEKSARNLVNLAQSGRFFKSAKAMSASEWERPGPLGDYGDLFQRISGPNPTSLESKISNGLELWKDPNTGAMFFRNIDANKKKVVGEVFLKFTESVEKFYTGRFSVEDAQFISSRMMVDRNGIWIKDPVHLEQGVALCWKNSKTDAQTKLMLTLVDNYNKLYTQWAESNNFPASHTIKSSPISMTRSKETGDLNYLRGYTSEDMVVIIHHMLKQEHDQAAQLISQVVSEYDRNINEAYKNVIPFWEGLSAADKTLIDVQGTVEELQKLNPERKKGDTFLRTLSPRDRRVVVARRIIPKIAIFESQSMMVRKPLAVVKTSQKKDILGYKADVEEYYESPEDLISTLRNVYGYDDNDLQEFAGSNTLRIGLKHYVEEGTFLLSEASIDSFNADLRRVNSPFIDQTLMTLNIPKEEVTSVASDIDVIYNGILVSFHDKQVTGYSPNELNKSNIQVLFDKIKQNCNYDDLLELNHLEKSDLSDPEVKKNVRLYIQKQVVLSTIQKVCNQKDSTGALTMKALAYRKYLASFIYAGAGSEVGQIHQFRSFDTGRQYIVNHNKALRLALTDFIEGRSILDTKDPRVLKIVDPQKGMFTLNCRLRKNNKGTKVNTFQIQMSKDYARYMHTPSRIKMQESVELRLEKLLEKLLSIDY